MNLEDREKPDCVLVKNLIKINITKLSLAIFSMVVSITSTSTIDQTERNSIPATSQKIFMYEERQPSLFWFNHFSWGLIKHMTDKCN
ncbi:MAG: hypothetical protein WCR02_04855 [Sphaerochaetaceae bacterium]|jgi:hypothetical protein